MADWLAQEAVNETIFREMNEWTEEAGDARLGADRTADDTYLCECSDRRCSDPIKLSRTEYESIRSVPIRFAIALNHENPLLDVLLFQNRRFATVEKMAGQAATIARSRDPRR